MSSIFEQKGPAGHSQVSGKGSSKIVVTARSRTADNEIRNFKVSSVDEARSLGRSIVENRNRPKQ